MGLTSSKIAINSLTNQKLGRISRKNVILRPQLCAAIFNRTSGFCHNQDILELKNFLKSDANVSKSASIKDKEILKIFSLKNPKLSKLTPKSEDYLLTILQSFQNVQNKPKLLKSVILPSLETIYAENKALQESQTLWKSLTHFIYSLFFFKMSAKIIRKEPKLKSLQGIDRAHVFSLSLATDLWELIYGDKFIGKRDKKCLTSVLRSEANLIYACKFTNRVTHVKYDHEILQAILYPGSPSLSFGAKSRVRDIIKSLKIIEKTAKNSKKIRHFLNASKSKLETIL